ncbi:cyclic nucleotide-binding domain-containing protein [Serratia marcescens]|uniref:Crp/Fnr family transcriptional regulator n=1 Tax=Serratia marcescens TaxID=615 RepID=UPI001EEFEDE4|nr:cyclic nucleotide-binding domain-containing protein [Serratia marcescens]ULH11542.1 cyclic nucleotide-binding domain-containing protein [Serratia marcescens]
MLKSLLRDTLRQRPSQQYGKKTYLWREGDKRSGLWLIKFGAVKTFFINPRGDEHITGFYLPGEYLGLDELSGELHRGYAQVIDDCAVHRLPATQLSEFMEECGERRHIYQLMSEYLRLNKARFHQLSHMSAGEKLAHFIYDLAVRYGYPGCIRREFRLPVLRCDIANYIGVTPETVTREMLKMVDIGAFRFSGRNISALRPSVLVQLAGDTMPGQNDEQSLTAIRRAGYGQ